MVIRQKFYETGKRYARLTVLRQIGVDLYLALCDCGSEHTVHGWNIRNGKTKSCGCMRRKKDQTRPLKHDVPNKAGLRAYGIWRRMHERCTNPKDRSFRHYGGRGIDVCARWDDFAAFLKDMGESPSRAHSIDRINNDGNYEPGNCRWATAAEQARNTRQNVFLTFSGKTQCMSDWARELGVPVPTLHNRLSRGWSPERALSTPLGTFSQQHRFLEFNGERMRIGQWEERLGLSNGALRLRLDSGWSIEDALTKGRYEKREAA